jgi:hypothetical protein
MKTWSEFFVEAKTDKSSSKLEAIEDLIDVMRNHFDKYDLPTRKFIWEKITSSKGQELIEKMLRSPKTRPSTSEFRKLISSK